jgi:hypothetical protein
MPMRKHATIEEMAVAEMKLRLASSCNTRNMEQPCACQKGCDGGRVQVVSTLPHVDKQLAGFQQ